MSRLLCSLLFCFALAPCNHARANDKKPNIVFIMADDLGIGDLSCYNAESKVETPNIDQLAAEGMRFTDVHASSSRCGSSRFSLMTGMHQFMRGKAWNSPFGDKVILPNLLKKNGYDTAVIGKWNLQCGWQTKLGENGKNVPDYSKPMSAGPPAWGFDHSFFMPVSANLPPMAFYQGQELVGELSDVPFDPKSIGSPPAIAAVGWSTEAIQPTFTQKAVAYLRGREGNAKPFFFYFPLTAPHSPVAPLPRFIRSDLERTHLYLPFVRQVDDTIGQVMQALDDIGVAGNTLIIVTSDNGSPATAFDGSSYRRDHEQLETHTGHRANGPWRGFKMSNWEGGHRVPFVLRWPGQAPAGQVNDTPFMISDTLATCAALMGEELPADSGIDSVDVLDTWRGNTDAADARERIMVHSDLGHIGIRQGDWKLMMPKKSPLSSDPESLYNLADDPGETTNLIGTHPEIAARLGENPARRTRPQDPPRIAPNLAMHLGRQAASKRHDRSLRDEFPRPAGPWVKTHGYDAWSLRDGRRQISPGKWRPKPAIRRVATADVSRGFQPTDKRVHRSVASATAQAGKPSSIKEIARIILHAVLFKQRHVFLLKRPFFDDVRVDWRCI